MIATLGVLVAVLAASAVIGGILWALAPGGRRA